jgi:hypothetical protein
MPRWLWALLLALTALLCWAGQRSLAPAGGASSMSRSPPACPPAPAYLREDQPRQSEVAGKLAPFRMGAATISPLAGFSLQARVLSREDYWLGKETEYSPTDLALGWGPMAAPGMAEKLQVRQGGRWYRYRWGREGPPLAPSLIVSNSANMHMVPADAGVASALARVHEGDTVRINGWLIRIDGDDGGRWQSSLSRQDQGAGACELVLLCSIERR